MFRKNLKIKFMKLSLLVVASVLVTGSTGMAGTGVATLSREYSCELDGFSRNILWESNDLLLVIPGTHKKETLVVADDEKTELYLVPAGEPIRQLMRTEIRNHPLTDRWSLVELPVDAVRNLVLPEDSLFLAYPYSLLTTVNDINWPEDITWDSRIQGFVDAVTQGQMLADLTTLADFQTRQSYTQGCRDAGEWLRIEFENLGYDVITQEHNPSMAPNVIAEKTGTSLADEIVIVCGHYDSISMQPQTLAPGADDNGTGTAAVLNAARVFADSHFERTIRFIAFSGEEQGLRGSQYYSAEAASMSENIVGVVNLDMIGYVDQAPEDLEVIGNNASTDLVDLFIDCAETYVDLPTNRTINGNITASDHAPFWTRGYQAMLGIEDYPVTYPYYHSIDDTVDKVNAGFMTDCTRASVATIAHLATPMDAQVYGYNAIWDDSSGDGDGYLDPNETVTLTVELRNNTDQPSGSIRLTLIPLSGNQYINIVSNNTSVPELQPGENGSNALDPFVLTVASEIEEFTEVSCIAAIQCDAPHASGYFVTALLTSYEFNPAIIQFNMDLEPGWTADHPVWEWGQPQGLGGDERGYPDPGAGFTEVNVLGTNLAGDYPPNINATVTSPVLDFTEIRNAELRFARWLNVEQPTYDRSRVWIVNGEGNQMIWGNNSELTDNGWVQMNLDISEHADGRDDVQIAFSLQTDGGLEFSGWNIDDITIAGLSPNTSPPTPTPTPAPNSMGIELQMFDVDLEQGDRFELTALWWNQSGQDYFQVPAFILLDIQGAFWFWPSWGTDLDHETWDLLNGATEQDIPVISFTWPEVDGSATDLNFWAALTTDDYQQILGSYNVIQWQYR